MKKNSISLLIILFSLFQAAALSPWAENFGSNSPYPSPEFITGFGTAARNMGEAESLETAKSMAMEDLIRKIQVHVKSEVVREAIDLAGEYSANVSVVSQSISSLKLSGIDFLTEKNRRNQYVLAWARVSRIREMYADRGRAVLSAVKEGYRAGENAMISGDREKALDEFVKLLPLFPELLECRAVYLGLPAGSESVSFFGSIDEPDYPDLDSFLSAEEKSRGYIRELEDREITTLDDALRTIMTMLDIQGLRGDEFQVSALLYRDSDFSSPFGSFVSRKLEGVLESRLNYGRKKITVRGNYWENGPDIDLMIIAQDRETGEKLGSGHASVPVLALPREYDLKPANFEDALITHREIAEGALADGGLSLEIWTNRGRNEDVLVFSEWEVLEIYIRVNRPAFVQLTYNLATGEKVLLEESFYLGIDQVNQVVRYPIAFEIVPPFGVERLMATAYSIEPPPPNIVPTIIDGEEYEVFSTTEAVVSLTRGLRKKKTDNNEDVKMGEAFLTITTLPE